MAFRLLQLYMPRFTTGPMSNGNKRVIISYDRRPLCHREGKSVSEVFQEHKNSLQKAAKLDSMN